MPDSTFRLGRIRETVPESAPRLAGKYLSAIKAPERLDRSGIDPHAQMLLNDTLGDCTCAAMGNLLSARAAILGFEVQAPDSAVLALYERVGGYVPGDAATDRGAVMTDVMASVSVQGWDIGQQVPATCGWGVMDPGDFNGARVAGALLAGANWGVNLAAADMAAVQAGAVMDTSYPASYGDPAPGSLGGHDLIGCWDWTGTEPDDTVRLITWGGLYRATWRWVASRLEINAAVAWPQLKHPYDTIPWADVIAECGARA
ncbi:MAG TPA: hypothetical protein PK231_05720 [Acidocella sp.]|nr:hypothetical protein [Acidocella sp.]